MAELIQRIRTQLNDFYKSLDKRKKMWLAGGGLFVVIFVAAIMFLTRPQYVPVASDIDLVSMAAIVDKLDEMSIQHKEDGTNSILVDIDDLTKAKMAIAVDLNISQPDFSWTDVFANTSFTMTSDVKAQQVNQAKATALKRALKEGIEGVKNARVELYIAPDSTFILDKEKESSVSVMLELENGITLSPKQVNGLVNFMMNSISNLPKENITIIDQTGVTLNKFTDDTDAFIASSQLEQTTIVTNQIESKLHNFLASIYGRTGVKVMASVVLNFDDYTSSSTAYSPPNEGETEGMIRSVSAISESVVGNDSAAGVPGTDSNGDATNYPTGSSGTSDIESKSETINYEMNEIYTVLTRAKGTMQDVTISILIDTKVLEGNILTEEHKSEVESLVNTAAGVETRAVNVVAVKFAEADAGIYKFDSEDSMITPGVPLWLIGIILGAVTIIVIVVFLVIRARANKKRLEELASQQAAEEEKRISELEEIQTDQEDKSSPKYQIEKFIEAKPEAVASLLRSWMSEN